MTFHDARRARYLQEMGVGPVWRLRDLPVPDTGAGAGSDVAADPPDQDPAPVAVTPQLVSELHFSAPAAVKTDLPPAVADARPVPERRAAASIPVEDDVPPWVLEEAPLGGDIPYGESDEEESLPGKPSAAEIMRMDWQALESAVSSCTKCRLCETRTRTVFGTGDRRAAWLFVGEGPGYNEDLQGEPFVGPAGKLLDNMLAAMGLKRGENAFIANVVKCHPIGENGRDRPPAPDEAAACLPYLERQIALIRPDVIVALGKTAALALLKSAPETPVSALRGQLHRYAEVPLVVTYHPAYLLRSPADKGKAWRDLCLAMAIQAKAAPR